jgi:hypothetical protein
MEGMKLQEEKERRRKKALEEHARLHELFLKDRFAFEREKRKSVNQVIESAQDDALREKLRAQQSLWDTRMKNAGSPHNRLVLAQSFFWNHFHETWLPAIRRLSELMNTLPREEHRSAETDERNLEGS